MHFAEAAVIGTGAKGAVAELPVAYALALWPAQSVYVVRDG
jgi:hypothetical protein